MNGRIHLRNMVFYGYHGNISAENTLGQRFEIDLTLHLDIAAATRTDDLADTADYGNVYEVCRGLAEGVHVKLLETLAARIIDGVLQACPRVTRVDIVIRKPSVPLRGVLDHVALETSRTRD